MTNSRKDFVTRSCVTCPKCSYEIPMLTTKGLSREFSVRCPKCEGRKLYETAQIHDQREAATTVRSPEHFEFARRNRDDQNIG
jgi:ssDNA-binding Zn-finger/Zn-ribbon topoisomerase 1